MGTNTPDNETAADSLEVAIADVILKHRRTDNVSAEDVVGILTGVMFIMASTQPDPGKAITDIKFTFDKVYETWCDTGKPDVLSGLIERLVTATSARNTETKKALLLVKYAINSLDWTGTAYSETEVTEAVNVIDKLIAETGL